MKRFFKILVSFIIFCLFIIFSLSFYVKNSTKKYIIEGDYSKIKNYDCIVVLGAGIWGNTPSPMLRDRLDTAIDLYKSGVAPKIIMSGDHAQDNHDEVNVMKNYAVASGVPSEDIFMDHAGFSTYDSMYRAKYIFGAKKVVIVTQEYHLYRAMYISERLGMETIGVSAAKNSYTGQEMRDLREILARDKDFIKCIFKPKSEYMGKEISLNDSGDITNDKD